MEKFTQDVRTIADWLKQCGIVTVAMQCTGLYWLPVYKVLVDPVRRKPYHPPQLRPWWFLTCSTRQLGA